jgi:subtilisin family serine protease
VLYAEPNFRITPDGPSDDPRFGSQWNLARLGLPGAWTVSGGSQDVVVAVLDSGVEIDHPDLQGNLWTNPGETGAGRESNGLDDDANGYVDDWRGWHFDTDAYEHNDPTDYGGHGTHAAGVIGAVGGNGIGISGVSPRVRIMPLSVWGNGSAGVAEAIAYADSFGVRAANGSFGIPYSQLVEDALAAAPNLLLSVSAGNQAWNVEEHPEERYPCVSRLPNVVCVAATDQSDGLAGFSNWGADSVDLGAPGVGLPTLGLPRRTLLEDYFQAPLDARWATGGTGGTWAVAPGGPEWDPYGGNALQDSPGEPTPVDADMWVGSARPFDLRAHAECKLHHSVTTDLGAGDVLSVEASRGDGAWTPLAQYTGAGFARSGSPALTAFEGASAVHIRFRLASDATGQGRGASFHWVNLFCSEPPFHGTEYLHVDGTSFAAPHVAGTAALLLARDPSLTAPQLRARILGTVTPLPALAGRTATGGRLDTARALGYVPPRPAPPAPPRPPPPAGEKSTALPILRDRRAPRCRLRLGRPRGRLLRVVASCDEAGRLVARLANGRKTLARTTSTLRRAGGRGLRLRLKRVPRGRVTLSLTAIDAAGNRSAVTRRLRLRRAR